MRFADYHSIKASITDTYNAGRDSREEEILGMIDSEKVLEVGIDTLGLIWKQRFNRSLETLKNNILKK